MYNCMFSRLINSEIIADPLKPIIIKLITVCARRNRFQNWKRSIKSINNLLFFCIWTGTRAKLRARAHTHRPYIHSICLYVRPFNPKSAKKKRSRKKKNVAIAWLKVLQSSYCSKHFMISFFSTFYRSRILKLRAIKIHSLMAIYSLDCGQIEIREILFPAAKTDAFEYIRQVHGMVGSKSGPNHHINRDHY